MLDLSFEKLLVLGVVAMFVLGPERLPVAAAWLGRTVRNVKSFAHDANERIRAEIGPEFDEIRGPLRDLRADLGDPLAWRNPRAAVIRQLFDDPSTTAGYAPAPAPSGSLTAPSTPSGLTGSPQRPLSLGERPPIDPDAT